MYQNIIKKSSCLYQVLELGKFKLGETTTLDTQSYFLYTVATTKAKCKS